MPLSPTVFHDELVSMPYMAATTKAPTSWAHGAP